MDEPAVRVLTDEDLMAVGVTPGIVRRVAFESDTYWFGHGLVEAGFMTGWHHHGDNLTLGYVLSGAFHLEYGPGGRESIDIHAGEYFSVAGGAVHREGTVDDVPCSVVAVRVGEGPPYLVAMDGPEPE
jgi:uncharacterized RmlC-like cupin family protein